MTPKGGHDRVEGWALNPAGRPFLKVRVSAPAAEGAANTAVILLLSKTLARPKSFLRIVAGDAARLKMVEVDATTEAEIAAAFGRRP